MKPLYWGKRKQRFKDVSLSRCSTKVSKILEKHMWKSSCFNKESQGVIIIFFGLKIATIFWREITNDIKAETNKTPTTDSALTRKFCQRQQTFDDIIKRVSKIVWMHFLQFIPERNLTSLQFMPEPNLNLLAIPVIVSPFVSNAPFLYPMKTSENRKFFQFKHIFSFLRLKYLKGRNGITKIDQIKCSVYS